MSKRLGIRVKMRRTSFGLPQSKHLISFASYRKRIFCKPCNAHFGHLEEAAIPPVEAMAKGEARNLSEDDKLTLSLWATKTGMALLAAENLTDIIPQAHRDAVRHTGQPPDASWVGYFPWSGHPNVWGADNGMSTNGPEEALRGHTYSVVFTFGQLAFMFVGFRDPIPAGFVIGSGHYPIHQLWPPQPGVLHWPPAEPPAELTDIPNIVHFAPLVPEG
jgi:hypothetical protein